MRTTRIKCQAVNEIILDTLENCRDNPPPPPVNWMAPSRRLAQCRPAV